jgi:asparagine synthase (glutamine-hydrolysing)
MCGITGWVDWNRDLTQHREVARAMADTMVCRGPDAGDVWLSRHAALGHRRLAIIDLSGGAQPMGHHPTGDPAGSVVLTYSGEVYNFRELRAQLSAAGHQFRTRSDTEVVLRAYQEWGADCARRFVGMFAFAVWDGPREELLLVRDPLGIKPLYYADTGHGVLFGSEPKAILANPDFTAEVDGEGLAELLLTPTLKTPGHGIFRGLRELRPGRIARISRGGVRESSYWRLESRPHPDSFETTVRTVRDLLEETVDQQLVSDVPLCSLLSGGLDSSAISALAARKLAEQGADRLVTFSVDFAGASEHFVPDSLRPSTDGPYAQLAAVHLDTKHTEVVLEAPDLLVTQLQTMRARDLPGMGDMDVSLLMLCRAVREQATVALSGESADEVFGGYPWFHEDEAIFAPGFPWSQGRTGRFEVLDGAFMQRLALREYVGDRYAQALSEVPHLAGEEGRDRRLREVQYLNFTRFLPALLDRKDRMSMAASLEVRVPFCDHRLVEYLWNVPWPMKNVGGQEKGLLRRAVADLLPPEITWRRKSAFPVARDPAFDRAVRDRLRAILASTDSPLLPMLNAPRLAEALAAPAGHWGGPHSSAWLGYLVELETWLTTYRVRIV